MSAPPRNGLRQLLTGLSLAGIVPLAIVATVLLVALRHAQQAQLHESLRATAQALAASVEQRLDGSVRRLQILAALHSPAELEALSRRGAEILRANPDWSSLALKAPGGSRGDAHDRKVFAGEPAVSDLSPGGAAGTPAVEVGVPVMQAGRVAYGLFATLEPRELSALLRSQLRDAAAFASIADGAQRIVARSGEAGSTDAYRASARIRGTGWTLILSAPAAPADAALARSLAALAVLLVMVLVASGVFAWLIGSRLARKIEASAAAALDSSAARVAAADGERRRAEAERNRVLEEAQRAREHAESASRAKDEFLAMLGHELRNPLGAIRNAMRVIERLPASSADHKAARDIVVRQTAQLAKIVDDLLDVGRMVSGRIVLRRNLVDLAQATQAAVASVRAAEQGGVHDWQLDLRSVLVSADPTRLDQVLSNLLENAAKFTPAGGRIGVRLADEAGEAVLNIEDSGPGIRPDLLPHVFDLFARDPSAPEQGGLGIGLTLVRRMVELHGGSVAAQNVSPGPGARFTVRLPSIPEPEPLLGRAAHSLPAPRPARQARVLIVEDNDDARISLQRILQADGHLVSAARDGPSGLQAAMAGSPNIAVVDIGLPGMDGYELARAIRERLGSGVRLIALSGYGSQHDRQRAAEAGFDAHLTKPVDLDRLLALITEAAG